MGGDNEFDGEALGGAAQGLPVDADIARLTQFTVDRAADAIFWLDRNGRFVYANSAAAGLLGYDPASLLTMTVHDIDPAFPPAAWSARWESLRQHRVATNELVFRRSDGSDVPVEVTANYIEFEGKAFNCVFARDITERRGAELRKEQLVQADKMAALGTMVAGVAHEINNPTSFIMLNAPTLASAWDSVIPVLDEYRESTGEFSVAGIEYTEMRAHLPHLLSAIGDGAQRIKRIVADLKSFARTEPLDMSQRVDMNAVAESAAALMANALRKATGRYEVQVCAGGPVVVRGSAQRLQQVLINLITNACHAVATPNGEITIRIALEDAGIVVSVRDNGVGMDEDTLRQARDPFFTMRRLDGGAGLGLAVAHGILSDHGGELVLQSTPGEGTCAQMRLPRAEDVVVPAVVWEGGTHG